MEVKKDILWRVYLCFLGMILLGFVVIGRAFYIQQIKGSYWIKKGDSLHLKYLPIEAERGSIYSEDGNMLSTSVPVFDVFIDFGAEGLREKDGKRFKNNLDTLSGALSLLFKEEGKTKDYYKKLLQQAYAKEDRYFTLKKKISFEQYVQMRDFPLIRDGKNKSGFIFDDRDKRINPFGMLAQRTIGLSREDSTKNVGLERSYDSLLKGTKGQRVMRYIAGAYMPVEGGELIAPEKGKDIITTLDTYMQDVTETALMNMMVNNNSLHGTAIVMETATGKIKAIANLGQQKDKDGNVISDKEGKPVYAEDLNYGIGKATEPGSIFKLATAMSLIDDGYVNMNSIVDCEGGAKTFYGLKIKDSHLGAGNITVKDAFLRSSNVAFAKLAEQYYHSQPSRFINNLHKYRLDIPTGIDIVAASGKPTIKRPTNRSWASTTIPFMAHGYEELVTPLHMLMLYNAVANNGKMMRPYLVNAVRDYGIEIKKIEPQVLVEKVCSDETLTQLKECLKAVVDSIHGTAHKIVFDSTYAIAGKTGTAVTALNNKGYNKGNKIYQASFIGYFPAEQPRYTIAVVIQNSKESKLVYGADVAGTVFKEISDRIYAKYISTQKFKAPSNTDSMVYTYSGLRNDVKLLLNVMNINITDSAMAGWWQSVSVKNNQALLTSKNYSAQAVGIIPDVKGMGLKDAIDLLENAGLKVSVTGKGKVFNQLPIAGVNFKKGQTVNIILN